MDLEACHDYDSCLHVIHDSSENICYMSIGDIVGTNDMWHHRLPDCMSGCHLSATELSQLLHLACKCKCRFIERDYVTPLMCYRFECPANRYIFKSRLDCSESTAGSLRQSGSEFQTVGPATEKAWVPKVPRRTRGTNSWWRLADHRCWRPGTSETGTQ